MAVSIESIEELNKYFSGVVKRAEHHAGEVNDIIYPLLGFVILKASYIKARFYRENPANVLTVEIDNRMYCIMYSHGNECIEIRENNLNGKTLCSFDNSSTIKDIKNFFNNI